MTNKPTTPKNNNQTHARTMKSNNFPDKELLDMPPDMEGVTRAEKDTKTKKFRFIVNCVGNAPMKLTTYAENKKRAIKYVEARWRDCKWEIVE